MQIYCILNVKVGLQCVNVHNRKFVGLNVFSCPIRRKLVLLVRQAEESEQTAVPTRYSTSTKGIHSRAEGHRLRS